MAEARDDVVVDHAHRLHEGIGPRRAEEPEATSDELLADPLGLRRDRGDLRQLPPPVVPRLSPDEVPEERPEASELLPDLQRGAGVRDDRPDLLAVPYDAGVLHQLLDPRVVEGGDLPQIVVREGVAIAAPLLEHELPVEPGLRAFEDQVLEEVTVVVRRHAPFLVVVLDHQRALRPFAAPDRHQRGFSAAKRRRT
jgi:hypothetical protein